jgi:predicted RNA-binding Zn ribbon-like protein
MEFLSSAGEAKISEAANGPGAGALELVSAKLCLNFANTVGNHKSDEPNERIDSYLELLAWSRHVGIFTDQLARQLARVASRHRGEAKQVLDRAMALREAIYRIFSAVSEQDAPHAADVAILNDALSSAMSRARLVRTESGFAWNWAREEGALDQMLWPIARSAAELLTSDELDSVRECANDTCGWLFVDTSKNHSRRWCSMSDCGNRAKARRHYARVHSNKALPVP